RNDDKASELIVPQLACGAGTPKPKKLRKASVKIAFGIVNVSVTRIAPIALGTKCLVIIRTVLAPKDLDAKINSSDFNFNTSPLTILAIPIQHVIVIAIINILIHCVIITINKITTSSLLTNNKLSAICI